MVGGGFRVIHKEKEKSRVVEEPPEETEDNECPICLEELDATDKKFIPCQCGYQVCLWCWHQIKEELNGKCPACRTPYGESGYEFDAPDPDEIMRHEQERRKKESQSKTGTHQSKRALQSVRVIQRNLVYVIGLSPSIAKEEVLSRHEFFGQYGRLLKVVLNKAQYHGTHSGPSYSSYLTYAKNDEAQACIMAIDGVVMDNRIIRASFGTTKYCSYFLRNMNCTNPDCMYLHDLGEEDDSFTKEEMSNSKHLFAMKDKQRGPPMICTVAEGLPPPPLHSQPETPKETTPPPQETSKEQLGTRKSIPKATPAPWAGATPTVKEPQNIASEDWPTAADAAAVAPEPKKVNMPPPPAASSKPVAAVDPLGGSLLPTTARWGKSAAPPGPEALVGDKVNAKIKTDGLSQKARKQQMMLQRQQQQQEREKEREKRSPPGLAREVWKDGSKAETGRKSNVTVIRGSSKADQAWSTPLGSHVVIAGGGDEERISKADVASHKDSSERKLLGKERKDSDARSNDYNNSALASKESSDDDKVPSDWDSRNSDKEGGDGNDLDFDPWLESQMGFEDLIGPRSGSGSPSVEESANRKTAEAVADAASSSIVAVKEEKGKKASETEDAKPHESVRQEEPQPALYNPRPDVVEEAAPANQEKNAPAPGPGPAAPSGGQNDENDSQNFLRRMFPGVKISFGAEQRQDDQQSHPPQQAGPQMYQPFGQGRQIMGGQSRLVQWNGQGMHSGVQHYDVSPLNRPESSKDGKPEPPAALLNDPAILASGRMDRPENPQQQQNRMMNAPNGPNVPNGRNQFAFRPQQMFVNMPPNFPNFFQPGQMQGPPPFGAPPGLRQGDGPGQREGVIPNIDTNDPEWKRKQLEFQQHLQQQQIQQQQIQQQIHQQRQQMQQQGQIPGGPGLGNWNPHMPPPNYSLPPGVMPPFPPHPSMNRFFGGSDETVMKVETLEKEVEIARKEAEALRNKLLQVMQKSVPPPHQQHQQHQQHQRQGYAL